MTTSQSPLLLTCSQINSFQTQEKCQQYHLVKEQKGSNEVTTLFSQNVVFDQNESNSPFKSFTAVLVYGPTTYQMLGIDLNPMNKDLKLKLASCLIDLFPLIATTNASCTIRTYNASYLYDLYNAAETQQEKDQILFPLLLSTLTPSILFSDQAQSICTRLKIDLKNPEQMITNPILTTNALRIALDPYAKSLTINGSTVSLTNDFFKWDDIVSPDNNKYAVTGVIVLHGIVPNKTEMITSIQLTMSFEQQVVVIETMNLEKSRGMNVKPITRYLAGNGDWINIPNYYGFLYRINLFDMMTEDQQKSIDGKEIHIQEITIKNEITNTVPYRFTKGTFTTSCYFPTTVKETQDLNQMRGQTVNGGFNVWLGRLTWNEKEPDTRDMSFYLDTSSKKDEVVFDLTSERVYNYVYNDVTYTYDNGDFSSMYLFESTGLQVNDMTQLETTLNASEWIPVKTSGDKINGLFPFWLTHELDSEFELTASNYNNLMFTIKDTITATIQVKGYVPFS